MNSKNMRSSNFELCRIVAMLMIISFHIIFHWPFYQLQDAGSITRLNNGYFSHPEFYKKLWIIDTFMLMGYIGNGLFMMISGYFMASKENINLLKTSKKLLFQLAFATELLMIASTIIYYFLNQKTNRYIGLVEQSAFNKDWWFIGYYFSVIVVAALFLNKVLIKFDKRKYLTFLFTLFAITQFSWSGSVLDSLASGIRTLGIGIFLYALGGYIHKYNPFGNVRTYVFFLVILVTNILNYLSAYNGTKLNIENYIRDGSDGIYKQGVYWPNDLDIRVVIIVIAMFEIFNRIHIPNNRVVNFLGAATFMTYLLHENTFFQSLYNVKDCITLLYYHPFLFVLKVIQWVFIAFSVGVIGYSLYLGCIHLLKKSKPLFLKSNNKM